MRDFTRITLIMMNELYIPLTLSLQRTTFNNFSICIVVQQVYRDKVSNIL